ncbi:MAG TPA: DUF1302 domain-containing protein [Thauera sp.]|uniref:DUF1302 domain-containing protein n=1 Tax=Thauera sp. 28 TaxID=303682 RepID=UPI0002CF18F4|nr:DUF1302 family protein [Thauera sp. 28]ENO94059.1 PduX [Thauera sp. 28]HAY11328.1 DUF1302 domain-containing protein [Thauera sp.]HRJ24277.1 DUF1302 family protein [Thauera sp.]
MKLHKKMKPVALAVIGMGVMAPAMAFEAIQFDNGAVFESRLTSTYTLSTRLENRAPLLANNAGGNDGNNNFDKGALTANRLSLLLDTHFKKGNSGFILSASTFYDNVYHSRNDNDGTSFPNKLSGPANQFSSEAKRYHGGYSRLLDAYGYTSFNVGEQGRATVRLGKHVVSWGETLFIPGISGVQGPADGTKAGIPGTEVKDQLLPEDQISALYEVNERLSLMAHAQYGWHKTLVNAPGSFMSTSDAVGPGAVCLTAGPAPCGVPRRADDKPGKTGQWGVGAKYRITDETEVGLIYLNYHDRAPMVDVDYLLSDGSGFGFNHRYFEDVKMLGATFSTSFGIATLGGEISYRKDAPALVSTRMGASVIPTATTADVLQTNLNTFINLGRTFLAPQANFLAEIAYTDVRNPDARRVPGATGDTSQTFAPGFGVVPVSTPTSDALNFGSYGLAFASTLSLTYPGIIENWELGVPISYSRQLKGRTLQGNLGMGEGDHRLSVGATMTYRRNLQIGLTYLGYFGEASLHPVKNRQLTDRDQLSLVVKYTF